MLVKALYIDRQVGSIGYVGAVLADGENVALCSVEKWALGPNDSLREGWTGDFKTFDPPKQLHYDYSEKELRERGLNEGTWLEMRPFHDVLGDTE